MTRLCCIAQVVAALALAGCGTVEIFGRYDLPEGAGVAEAPWPRLIDTPGAPPVGTYTADVPDPARGARAQADLSATAIVAGIRATELARPVIVETERAAMLRRARRKQP